MVTGMQEFITGSCPRQPSLRVLKWASHILLSAVRRVVRQTTSNLSIECFKLHAHEWSVASTTRHEPDQKHERELA